MEYPQAVVSVVVFWIYVFIGVPVWWNTTKVYRASLPYEKIDALQNASIKLQVSLNIQSDIYEESELNEAADVIKNVSVEKIILNVFVKKVHFVIKDDVEEYCKNLYRNSTLLLYNIIVIKDALNKKSIKSYCRTSLTAILSLPEKISSSDLGHQIFDVIDDFTRSEDFMSKKLSAPTHQNTMPLAPGYHLTFTLGVSNPADFLPSWDIDVSVDDFLKPILKKFSFLGPFKVSSQVLYYVDLGIKPFKSNESFYYTKSKLPQLINPIESRLASHVTTDPILNFVIYVPPKKHSPLYIRQTKNSEISNSSSFYSPRWGGIAFYNPTHFNEKIIYTRNFMEIFIKQFELLVGVKSYFNETNDIEFSRTNLLIEKTFENLRTCLSTLSSLSKLLDEIANIVIKDEIKELVEIAVLNVEQSKNFLQVGDLEKAHQTSKEAFLCSEKAFYDSSLLSLLYFPDDQKYAIYVPLFLPISLPVIMSFFRAVKWLIKYHKKQKEE